MLKYQIIPVTAFGQNCTLLWCDQTNEAAIVDPGGDAPLIMQAVKELAVKVTVILLTHGHLDHVGAAAELAKHYQVKVIGPHKADAFWLDALPVQSQRFGLPECPALILDRWLNDGDVVHVGNETLEVYHCPGHTPGHVIFFSRSARLAQVGDVLFNRSVGRTDFPQGSYDDLVTSIYSKLWPLGDDVVFIAGHGPMSNFGDERRYNPFVGENK